MSSDDAIGIGAAARTLGTTERALRYYEQRGLLPPAPLSTGGHRRYDEAALRRARRLLALRELGLPLDVIGGLVAQPERADLSAVLRTQAARLDAERDELGSLRARIDALLAASSSRENAEQAVELLEELAMKIVLRRIYTRTGDDGTTALAGQTRVDKTDPRLEAMGDVDELVSALGLAVAAHDGGPHTELLRSIQNDLFDLGADLAASGNADPPPRPPLVGAAYTTRLERGCDEFNADLEPPASFVLPGSTPASAALHLARAICRRAERHAWAVPEVADEDRQYLNRLSDLLFILARATETGPEPTWDARGHRPATRMIRRATAAGRADTLIADLGGSGSPPRQRRGCSSEQRCDRHGPAASGR